jgi:hypothetical protein
MLAAHDSVEEAMHSPSPRSVRRNLPVPLILGVANLVGASFAAGQGCMPMRVSSPVFGSQGDVYLPAGTWQAGLAFRGYTSDQKILGNQVRNDLAPHGQPTVVTSRTLNLSVAYAVSDRLALTLNVPFSDNSHTNWYADSARHTNTATGLGEVTLIASYWLRKERSVQPIPNLAIGVGVKAPTGKNDVMGKWWNKDGSTVPFPVHQSIELGDGGWGIILEAQGVQPILSRVYLYAGGSYTLSTRDTTDVAKSPTSKVHYGVPDVWGARAGASMVLWPAQGISASLGVRFDGTPLGDVIGGKDLGFRHPATVGYVDPAIAFTRGPHTLTLNVPARIYMNWQVSYADQAAGTPDKGLGGGLPDHYNITATYSVRF